MGGGGATLGFSGRMPPPPQAGCQVLMVSDLGQEDPGRIRLCQPWSEEGGASHLREPLESQ